MKYLYMGAALALSLTLPAVAADPEPGKAELSDYDGSADSPLIPGGMIKLLDDGWSIVAGEGEPFLFLASQTIKKQWAVCRYRGQFGIKAGTMRTIEPNPGFRTFCIKLNSFKDTSWRKK